jgi:hypothetical protein
MGLVILTLSSFMISIMVRMESKLRAEKESMPQLRRFSSNPGPKFDDTTTSSSDKSKPMSRKQEKKLFGKDENNVNTDKDILEIYKTFDDPPVIRPSIVDPNVQDFDPNLPGMVVVTKIQGPPHLRALRQMLCLFTKAYNDRAHREIVVFTSEPIDPQDIRQLQQLAVPAQLTVEVDNPGLHEMIQSFTPQQQKELLQRCHAKRVSDLTWYSQCDEERSYTTLKGERLAYTWQAEFRALHLWTHPALKGYRYMMWMDSDAFCTRVWKQDPLAAMMRYDLILVSTIKKRKKDTVHFSLTRY